MKYLNQLRAAMAVTMVGLLVAGCHSDIDFTNIDGRAEVDMGLVLPVGSIKASLKDVLGKVPNIYIDSLNNMGVITWKDTFNINRKYHQVDLKKYISSKEFGLNVHDRIAADLDADNKITGNGSNFVIDFPMTLKLEGINKELDEERLDSALIELANFTTTLNQSNMPEMKWEYVQKVELDLGSNINRPAGNKMTVYTKDGSINSFGQPMPIEVDNFTICMMKNRNLTPNQYTAYRSNVVDSCVFHCYITLNIPAGTKVTIPNDAQFRYDLKVQFIDYKALWGFFKPSNEMHDADTLDFTEAWGDLNFLKKARLPFSDPVIRTKIYTHVAGALIIHGDHLFTVDSAGNEHYAEFGASNSYVLEHHFPVGEYLDPVTSNIGDSTENTVFVFDKSAAGGRIDKLFGDMPQLLSYNFKIDFDWQKTPQIRVTQNTNMRVEAEATLPMMFNQGTKIAYTDTLKNVNLSKVDLDSMLNDVEIIDTLKLANIKLLLLTESTIPLQIKALFRCYDKNGNIIKDPEDPSKPLTLFESDTLRINPPKFVYANGVWNISEANKTNVVASISKKQLDVFPEIDHIMYSLWVDDESLDYAFQQGAFNVKITGDSGIKMQIGLTGHVDAVLNLNGNKDKNNK
ncbi:MAG: hypothetical protein J5621_00180 [Paludibacteraceae bacterium]|nr:hypothetical protein [Paludibacteraceae bacterium]